MPVEPEPAFTRLEALYRDVERRFEGIRRRHPGCLECRSGCSDCCRARLSVNRVEEARLREGLARLAAATRREFARRAADPPRCSGT